MPAPILKAGPHRARPFGTVTVETVVSDEELTTGVNRALVALVGIPDRHRLDAKRKSGRQILFVLHEPKTVSRNQEMTRIGSLRGHCAARTVRSARIPSAL